MSGPCLSSSVTDRPLRPATRRRLGGPLPPQQDDRTRANPAARAEALFNLAMPWGINPPFGGLSPTAGHVTHVLLTRAPLGILKASFMNSPYNLHVLNTPPAFVLSQNQTLRKKTQCSGFRKNRNSYIEIDPGETTPIRKPGPSSSRAPMAGIFPFIPSKKRAAHDSTFFPLHPVMNPIVQTGPAL